jgi:hypothetical protein
MSPRISPKRGNIVLALCTDKPEIAGLLEAAFLYPNFSGRAPSDRGCNPQITIRSTSSSVISSACATVELRRARDLVRRPQLSILQSAAVVDIGVDLRSHRMCGSLNSAGPCFPVADGRRRRNTARATEVPSPK